MIVELIIDENGEVILPLPDELFLDHDGLIGDVVDFTVGEPYQIEMDNLSRLYMSAQELQEDFVSLLGRIESDTDPLNRIIVTRNGVGIAVIKSMRLANS